MTDVALLTVKDYRSDARPTWCPGCGDFAVLSATYKTMAALQLKPHEVVVVSGIGCSGRIPYFIRTYGLHGLHGRALPLATGIKLANPQLAVFCMGGDGDLFAIGGGHLPHAAHRNIDITCVCMDNSVYGLTKGQTSPTSPRGHKTKSTPYGTFAHPLNPVMLALAYGATFVARAYSARPQQLADLMVRAVKHKGFSFIHVESPCTEFNNTYNYFDSMVEDLPPDHDPTSLARALNLSLTEERVHLGLFYQVERPVYEEEARAAAGPIQPFNAAEYLSQYE